MSFWDDVQTVYEPYPGAIITPWLTVGMLQPVTVDPVEVEGAELIRWATDGGAPGE